MRPPQLFASDTRPLQLLRVFYAPVRSILLEASLIVEFPTDLQGFGLWPRHQTECHPHSLLHGPRQCINELNDPTDQLDRFADQAMLRRYVGRGRA